MNKTFVSISSLLLATACCMAADDGTTEKTITKTFTVAPGGALSVDADQGDIEVKSGGSSAVEIVIEREVHGGSDAQQAKILKANKVTFDQSDNKISVESKSEKKSHIFFSHEPNLESHFRITVPKRFDVTLETAGGNIKVIDIKGAVDARTSGGNEDFAKIDGRVEAHTSGGNLRASDCADALNLVTSGGNIVIKNYTGPSAQADTSGGNIDVNACSGKLAVKTSGGNIGIDGFSGPSVFADTSGGAVSLKLDKEPAADCLLRTSGGSITARVPEDIAVNLAALTDGGSVTSDLPVTMQGKMREGRLEGKINGGGPNFMLRTSGGDIEVLKK
jgi:DUF4097 and DUF4098 domain-containing protein YvlB